MIEKINIDIFQVINAYAGQNSIIDRLAIVLAEYLPVLFVFWLLYLWLGRDNQRKNYALFAGYSAVVGLLINFIITTFYFHPRPFMIDLGKLLINHAAETSFPSNHTTFMLSIAFTLVYFKETRTSGLILSILGLIGGLSRVFSGVHFPMDIIGSLGVALISSFLIYSLRSKLKALNQMIIKLYFRLVKNKNF